MKTHTLLIILLLGLIAYTAADQPRVELWGIVGTSEAALTIVDVPTKGSQFGLLGEPITVLDCNGQPKGEATAFFYPLPFVSMHGVPDVQIQPGRALDFIAIFNVFLNVTMHNGHYEALLEGVQRSPLVTATPARKAIYAYDCFGQENIVGESDGYYRGAKGCVGALFAARNRAAPPEPFGLDNILGGIQVTINRFERNSNQ